MREWWTHELHPLCTLFPRLEGAEFDTLVQDIRTNGLREPIVLHDGMILDGGNRYRACQQAQIEPRFSEFAGESIVSYVLSANLHRRHLSPGQQAAIVASAQDWAKAQTVGRPEQSGNVTGLATVADRAAQSGASDKTQRMADKVVRENPKLGAAVARGEVSLPEAHRHVSPPKPAPQIVHEEPPEPDDSDGFDLADMADQMRQELEAYAKVMDADEPLAAARKEIARLVEVARIGQSRIDGLMNENAVLKREVKRLQRKLDRG